MPADQQARVHAALQAVQAAALVGVALPLGAPRQLHAESDQGAAATSDDEDMLGDEEALSLAEELCGPGLQTESQTDHAARVLAAKLKVQQVWTTVQGRSRKASKVKK